MARNWWSYLRTPRGLRSGGVFVAVAIAGFGALVFLLFRGHSPGPQEAVAADTPSIVSPSDNPVDASPVAAGAPNRGCSRVRAGTEPAGRDHVVSSRGDAPAAAGGRCDRLGSGQPAAGSARRGHSSSRQAQQAAPGPAQPGATADDQGRDGQVVQGLALRAGRVSRRHAHATRTRSSRAICWTSSAVG